MNTKPIRTIVISEDPFSSATINLLLAKDWRTQVILTEKSITDLINNKHRISAVDILVADIQKDLRNVEKTLIQDSHHIWSKAKKVLLLTDDLIRLSKDALSLWSGGILLKREIGFCFAWALEYINKHFWVMTPTIDELLSKQSIQPPNNSLKLSNQNFLLPLSKRQKEAAILNIILGLDHQTLANTMGITRGSSYGLISSIYEKLEISDLLQGKSDIFDYIPTSSDIKQNVDKICLTVMNKGSTQINQKNGLVFHIVTCPQYIDY